MWVRAVHEGKAEDPFKDSQVPTDPLTLQGFLPTYWEPRLQPGQGRQLAELGSRPHLFQMGEKNCFLLFL